ncbi:MAG: LuxR C-terminal-related transcriptional regulator [Gaiellaceae bacterium]
MGEGKTVETTRAARRIIERPRLTRLLTESESRVMLLVAPAGYGKTTLAREWLAQGDREHAWYQVTPAASDVAALGLGLAKSAADVVSAAGDRLPARLRTVGDVSTPEQARSLAEGLAADLSAWPREVVLVIDDYHLLAGNEAADAFVETFVEGTTMPVLVASRTRPSWVTAKRLLYGDAIELGRNVLAMTHTEAAEALADTHDEMPGLVALAEGWPAVIGLAALVGSPVDLHAPEVPEMLHEYFAEELYQGLSPSLKWQLAQLSLVPSLDHDTARCIFDVRSDLVLREAYRSGFLTRGPRSYEMHPLLRRFLRTKLADFQEKDVIDTARILATAYLDLRRWDEAFSIGDGHDLADVILRVLDEGVDLALAEGRVATVEKWLERARSASPTAEIVRLIEVEVAFHTGDVATARSKASELASTIDAADPIASRIYFRAGQISHLDDRLEEALELFDAAEATAQTPIETRKALWSRFVSLTDLDDRERAADALSALESLPPLGVDDLLRVTQARLQSALRWGGVGDALQGCRDVLELVDRSDDPVVRTGFLQTYGVTLVLAARYREAIEIADREIDEARRLNLEWVVPHALEVRASALLGRRDFQKSLRTLARAQKVARGDSRHEFSIAVLRARVFLCTGAPDRALALLRNRGYDANSPLQGDFLATLGLALACSGELADARVALELSEQTTSHHEARVLSAFARAVASHFADANGELDADALNEACALAVESGNFDGFVVAYRSCPALLAHLSKLAIDPRPFLQVVEELDPRLAETLGIQRAESTRSGEDLTPREHEILSLVQQGLSNRQIARTLWVAESTVKVHMRHIFEKLGVRSRTQAAAAAENL